MTTGIYIIAINKKRAPAQPSTIIYGRFLAIFMLVWTDSVELYTRLFDLFKIILEARESFNFPAYFPIKPELSIFL